MTICEDDRQARADIIRICRRIHDRGFVSPATGDAAVGGVSVRLTDDRVLITPDGCALGCLEEDELVAMGFGGERFEGARDPSSDFPIQLAVYRRRPDIHGITCTCPVTAIEIGDHVGLAPGYVRVAGEGFAGPWQGAGLRGAVALFDENHS